MLAIQGFLQLQGVQVCFHCITIIWFQKEDVLTTGTGAPVGLKTATMTVGPRGPVLLQDFVFTDEMAHFNRERIPERVVHAKGAGHPAFLFQQF